MARAGPSRSPGPQLAGADTSPRKDSSFFDISGTRKEVLAAKSVVDEVRRRVVQLRGGQTKADREKEEKEKEEKLEKARAAAWAWYQHGKGGKESVSSSSSVSGGIGATTLLIRSGELNHKSSRFKTEALKGSGHLSMSQLPGESDQHRRTESASGPLTDSGRSWDFSNVPMHISRASSLFDSYELDSVSRRIDNAFQQADASAFPSSTTEIATTSRSGFNSTVPQVEIGSPEIKREIGGLPSPMRPPGASASGLASAPPSVPYVVSPGPRGAQQVVVNGSPKVTRSSSMRMQFPRCICSSISDVVTHEEMSLGVDIKKCDCPKLQGDGSGWSLRRITRAIQEFIHLPEGEYHPQQEHHERRHARLHLHHHHHHHHRHDHEYHHHLHYQIKLRDGMHHGNSLTTHPGKPNPNPIPVEVTKEKDYMSFPRLINHKSSPKVSPKLF
ncbi:unnamed protein product [Calypogeia fissa]